MKRNFISTICCWIMLVCGILLFALGILGLIANPSAASSAFKVILIGLVPALLAIAYFRFTRKKK